MNEELYNQIKEKYGKDASWAIWNDPNADYEDPFTLIDYQKVKDKVNPNVILVGFNPSDNIFDDFSNFHNLKNDSRHLHPNAIKYANRLKYAFINTEYEGAYMTDIIKLATIKGKVKLADSAKVKEYIKNHPEVVLESIKMFKEELDFIGSKEPLIIALGGDAYNVLSKLKEYSICKVAHYSDWQHYSNSEEYKKRVWEQIKDFKNGVQNQKETHFITKGEKNKEAELVQVAEETLAKFKKVAGASYIMSINEPRNGWIHILRNRRKIGCVIRRKDGYYFEFHNSHPKGRKTKINLNILTDGDMKDAIFNTP